MVQPLAIHKNALANFRAILRAGKRAHGEVEIGCLSLADITKPDEIVAFKIICGQNVSAFSFEASEEAVLETLHALDDRLIWTGICHAHPASGPFGHSRVDEEHIEGEMLPLIALARTPRKYMRRQLAAKLDTESGGQRYFLDPLERASVVVQGAGTVTLELELGVSEGSATSVVVLAPDYESRIYALRQRHRFTPMLASAEKLFHEQWNEEPIVEVTAGDQAEEPLDEEQAMDLVRRYVWAAPHRSYSIPRLPAPPKVPTPTRPFVPSARERVRENLQRTLSDARDLVRSVVELANERLERPRKGRGSC